MAEPRRPNSPLPDDPSYWEKLAGKIGEDAAEPLARYASIDDRTTQAWYLVLARGAPLWLAASVAAMLLLWVSLPDRGSVAHRWLEHSLAPTEAAGSLVGGPGPPSVDSLLAHIPLAQTPPPENHGGKR